MKDHRIHVWMGCNLPISGAVNAFSERWGPYSAKSRRYSIYRLVKETIDPSWQVYVATLQHSTVVGNLLKGLAPSVFAQKYGFRALEDRIISAILSYSLLRKLANVNVDNELVSTLETMRELSTACRTKRPRKTSIGINILRARPICELCGQSTELEAYRQRGEYMDYPIGNARLSARYCVTHRPWNHDGSYNPDYKRAIRNKARFENELTRLGRQTSKISEPCANTGDAAIDLFILNIVAQRGLYSNEENELRNIAHQLTEQKISDNKKRIVILAASCMNQSEIATYLDISRQAVSKALKSIPLEYRLDQLALIRRQQKHKAAN